jgi:formate hydrogenlyase transcriptional activator
MMPDANLCNGRKPGNDKKTNGTSPNGLPAGGVSKRPQVEDLLAQLSEAFPAGGDFMQLALLLLSGQRAVRGAEEGQSYRAEARYRTLVEQLPAVTFMAPLDGALAELYVSPQIEKLLGFSVQEWLGDPFLWYRQIHPDDRVRWAEEFACTCFSGERFRADYRFLARDGRVVWVHAEAKLVTDENGVPLFLHGVAFDITERKQAEAAATAAYEEIKRLKDQLQADNFYLQEAIKLRCNFGEIVGQSHAIQKVLHQVEQVAGTNATVLLLGETGTGKELLAHAIHDRSHRQARPMMMLNCAALPATLVESELFGREKGAYTGAHNRQIGRFEQADGSTLLLDEIGELPLDVQAKLLGVLQHGHFERLGGIRTLSADVRIIAASNRDLEKMVKEGKFREDLFYRLNVFPIRLPPLRERPEDIPLLVWAFVKELRRTMGKTIEFISHATMEALKRHPWPGNIRELRNVIERALIVARDSTLRVELPSLPSGSIPSVPTESLSLDEVQRRHILAVLQKTRWRISGKNGAAAVLGLKPSTLESRMAKLDIRRERVKPDIS